MPPVNTQGSRAGLITALVIFTVLFVTSAIFAIYFSVQFQKETELYTNYQKQYTGVVSDQAFQSPQFQALKALSTDSSTPYAGQTVLDVALKQRDDLASTITGAPADADAAEKAAQSTLQTAAKNAKASGVTVPQKGLTSAVSLLAEAVTAKQQQVNDLTGQLATAQKALTDAQASIKADNDKRDADLTAARASDAADLAKVNDQFKANSDTVAQLQKDAADAQAKAQAAAQADQAQLADLQHQISKLNDSIKTYQARLATHRPSVINAAVRQADGKIIRLAGNTCYINLGQGDEVTPGLTFEVYDAASGVPAIPENATNEDAQLPVGKASIEITNVGATSSECRIVRVTPGAALSEGDIIENLVYDPHTKYNFMVYGKFDLAQSGHPNVADAEVIKRLITQWGGRLTDKVNVDTDFVVLGVEPVLPEFSKDELEQPLNQDKLAKAQAELDKYSEVLQTARDLHIPIMNQNRFLYYVGYYDQAKR